MRNEPFYYDLAKKEREFELNFIIAAVLKSRIKLGLDEAGQSADEDVNVYLANLLFDYARADYASQIRELVSEVDLDVYNKAHLYWRDNAGKYYVYKVNADNLLISLGIFQNVSNKVRSFGRAKIYYELASAYNFKIYRKLTAAGAVLEKLAAGFEKYQSILVNVREDYFSLIDTAQEGGFSGFIAGMKAFEEKLLLREKEDAFLDVYSQWLKSRDVALQTKMCNLAKELEIINPEFKFKKAI